MRKKGFWKLVPWVLAIALTAFVLPLFLIASAADQKTIKVGYYEDGDYMSRNEHGEYTGFNFEYLQEISKYTGWEYEVVDCVSWEATFTKLQTGEIDLLPSVYSTPERRESLLFSDLPICNIYSTLNVRMDDNRYDYEDFDSFSGMKVGVIRGSVDAENFRRYCQENALEISITEYAETGELLAALSDQTLDGVAITHLGRNSTYRSVAQFSPDPLYIALGHDRTDLLAQLNVAMGSMQLRDPYYEAKLYEKYFSVSTKQKPVFTKEEMEYIESCGTIRAAYRPAMTPLEYTDSQSGAFAGVAADLFEQISADSGLQFEFVPVQEGHSGLEMVRDGSATVLCGVSGDYLLDQQNNINTTQYYLHAPVALISRQQNQEAERIALPQGVLLSQRVAEDNPDKQIDYYPNVKECFDALLDGRVDATYANIHVANYLLADTRYKGLSLTTLANYTDEISIGVSKGADPRLFSILDKSVQYTAEEEIDEMLLRNSLVLHAITWRDVVRQHPWTIVGVTAGIFSLIVVILCYIVYLKSKSNRRIRGLMYRDTLTGLQNLNKFRIEAQALLEQAPDEPFALVYLDINQFKTINDTFGFGEGDELLCDFAQVLKQEVREGECCARVSADQFVLLLHYGGWEELTGRTDRIDKRMNEILKAREKSYHLLMAFGVYVPDREHKQAISLMLDLANYARRTAKLTHKSRTILYDESMRKEELLHRELNDRMEGALTNGEFIPYFQPKVDMVTRMLIGSEALVRWNHPTQGMIPPGKFIPFFESNGFVTEIDLYLYERVCSALRSWMEKGLQVNPVSCNFSRLHLENDRFPDKLAEIADRYNVPHNLLELEITEGVVMHDQQRVQAQFSALRGMGFPVSIDDFGSGYSSLGILQQLPVDVLKLDRSFIEQGVRGKRAQAVIQGIVEMAKEMGIKVICEGVETQQQAEVLIEMGCFLAQGYFFGKPMPLKDFEKLIAEDQGG